MVETQTGAWPGLLGIGSPVPKRLTKTTQLFKGPKKHGRRTWPDNQTIPRQNLIHKSGVHPLESSCLRHMDGKVASISDDHELSEDQQVVVFPLPC